MYDSYLREYKEKQAEALNQMQDHSDADEQFYITANITLNIAKRAKEIFIENWIDVVIKPYWKWNEYIVVNPKVLKTESQLRKIREEANQKIPLKK